MNRTVKLILGAIVVGMFATACVQPSSATSGNAPIKVKYNSPKNKKITPGYLNPT